MTLLLGRHRAALASGGVGTAPPTVSGLLRWYDPSDSGSVVVQSGSAQTLHDLSGNGRTLFAPQVASQPLIGVTINGRAALQFDGTDDYLRGVDVSYFSGSDIPHTLFAVCAPSATAANAYVASICSSSAASAAYGYGILGTGPAWRILKRDDASVLATVSGGAPTTSPALLAFRHDGTAATVRVNGAQVASGACDVGAMTVGYFTLGAFYNGLSPAAPFAGKIGEVVAYAGALDAGAIAGVEAYLANRWGISI